MTLEVHVTTFVHKDIIYILRVLSILQFLPKYYNVFTIGLHFVTKRACTLSYFFPKFYNSIDNFFKYSNRMLHVCLLIKLLI